MSTCSWVDNGINFGRDVEGCNGGNKQLRMWIVCPIKPQTVGCCGTGGRRVSMFSIKYNI